MAKYYDTATRKEVWSDCDIYCPLEDAYFELSDFIAEKRLNGHDRRDQWYMLVHRKMEELLDVMKECPFDELDETMKPLF